jgi:hypothetical protein
MWKEILKQELEPLESIEGLIGYMVKYNKKNSDYLQQIWDDKIALQRRYKEEPYKTAQFDDMAKILEKYTDYVTREEGIRYAWTDLLQNKRIYGKDFDGNPVKMGPPTN